MIFDRLLERKETDISALTWTELFPQNNSRSGVSVNVDSALRTTTVLACARVLAEGIAQLPKYLFDIDQIKNTKTKNVAHPAYRLLAIAPNEFMTSFEFYETMMFHAVLTGNAFAYVGWAGNKIVEIIPLVPGNVQVVRAVDWSLTYIVSDLEGRTTTLQPENVLHLRGPSWDTYRGLSAVALAREAIGLAIATEETHASLHANGAQPGGVLAVKGRLDRDARERLKAAWGAFQGGVANRFKTAVLDVDAEWKPISMSGVDSQHLETRRFQIEEICRALNVYPQMVMHSDKTSTFASAEQFFLAYVKFNLMPWIVRWEQAINRTILGDDDNLVCKFSVDALMRGDSAQQATYFQAALGGARGETAWMTRNEVRAALDLNPIEGGDKLPMPPPAPVQPPGVGGGDNVGAKALTLAAEQFAKAFYAEQFAKAYNPDQPRDDSGRWAGGGATAAHATMIRALERHNEKYGPMPHIVAALADARAGRGPTPNHIYDAEKEIDKLHAIAAASKAYNPDQPRDDSGRWGSGGTAVAIRDNSHDNPDNGGGSHIASVLATAGGVALIAGKAVLAHLIASGAARALLRYSLTMTGMQGTMLAIAADIALDHLLHHITKKDDSVLVDAINGLSDRDAERLATALVERLSPEQVAALVSSFNSGSASVNPVKMNSNHDGLGRFATGGGDAGRLARAREQGYHTDEVVYHETNKTFSEFKPAYGTQVWFTTDKTTLGANGTTGASGHGKVLECYLKYDKLAGWDKYDKFTTDQLLSMGYQGARLGPDIVMFTGGDNIRLTSADFDPAHASSRDITKSNPNHDATGRFASGGGRPDTAGLVSLWKELSESLGDDEMHPKVRKMRQEQIRQLELELRTRPDALALGYYHGAKMNSNHDALGRFAPTGAGLQGQGIEQAITVKRGWIAASPIRSLDDAYARAHQNKPTLDAVGAAVTQETGAEYKGGSIKKPERVLDKIANGKTPAAVSDIVRSTFFAKSTADADKVVHSLSKRFAVVDEGYRQTEAGYFDRALNVKFENGQVGEVLIMPKEMAEAKGGGGHVLYEGTRKLPQSHPMREVLLETSKAHYQRVYDKLPDDWKAVVGSTGK